MRKNYTLLTIAVFLFSSAWAQKGDTLHKYLDEHFVFTNKSHARFACLAFPTGNSWFFASFYPEGDVMMTINFTAKDLKTKSGKFTFYHPGKIKAIEGYYVNNVRQGVWKYWYKNGAIRDSGLVKNNQLTGTWQSWYESGQLAVIYRYPAMDDINEVVYAPTLNNKKSYLFKGDTLVNFKQGISQSYFRNGVLKDSGLFAGNQKEGYWKQWHDNSQLESAGNYKAGMQEGDWQYYREDGSVSTKEVYANGSLQAMACYNEQGNFIDSFCSISKPPVPLLDRFETLESYASKNIQWPDSLEIRYFTGIVKVQFTITREGNLVNLTITQSPHELLSREVERFFKSLPPWSPAVSHNRTIDFDMEFDIPVGLNPAATLPQEF